MATQFEIDCAIMAGRAYDTTRSGINKFPVPSGWTEFGHAPSLTYPTYGGFEATSFTNGTKIVISFAGTNDKDYKGDGLADIGLASGAGSTQLLQAAEYFLNVKAANPDAEITFTGHSLGGGLASLMAVFFNEDAVTFDQAPFRNSASCKRATDLRVALTLEFSSVTYPKISNWLAPLDKFIMSVDPLGQGWSEDGLAAREAINITAFSVQGEFLSNVFLNYLKIGTANNTTILKHGNTDISGFELHSQSLLTTFLLNDEFRKVTLKLTDLLGMIFDKKLYKWDTDTGYENILERLVRHEVGVTADPANDIAAVTADAMLTRFTDDLKKIAQDGGLSLTNANVANALTAFAMSYYYSSPGAITPTVSGYDITYPELYDSNGVTGGIHFNHSDVSVAKGLYLYFYKYLDTLPGNAGRLITQQLRNLLDWYIDAGSNPMVATDQHNRGAFMLGWVSDDGLTGGTANDLLYGGEGTDTLTGGTGTDTLIGGYGDDVLNSGSGHDIYYYTIGDGNDQIIDSDRDGEIDVYGTDGKRISFGNFYNIGQNQWKSFTNGNITISGTILNLTGGTINLGSDFQSGDFGINLFMMPDSINQIVGDQNPANPDDYLYGTSASDQITGLTGNDIIDGRAGNDQLFAGNDGEMNQLITAGETAQSIQAYGDVVAGGAGDDDIYGSTGKDVLFGGLGKDLLVGGGGDDVVIGDDNYYGASHGWSYAITTTSFGNTISYQLTLVGIDGGLDATGTIGDADVIYGGTGNDYIDGVGGDDEIYGGMGNDSLFGSAGHDFIEGGDGDDAIKGDGYDVPVEKQGNDYIDGGAGNDLIWGNAGNDELFGGADNDKIYGDEGDDYLDGEAGLDSLYGGAGNDNMFGGDGDDYMEGDNNDVKGNDYLDGENGDDTLIGAGGADEIFGGVGNDVLHGDGSNVAVADQGDDYIDGEGGDNLLVGYGGNDTLYAAEGNDTIYGNEGDDYIDAGDGTNEIYGGDGNNEIYAGSGDDYILGGITGGTGTNYIDAGDGNNTVFGVDGVDEISAGAGNDWLQGGAGDDYLDGGAGNNTLLGGEGNDELFGGSDVDLLQGDAGDDYLEGFEGNDTLMGSNGNDTLFGGDGDDKVQGDAGDDCLDGGAGNDYMLGMDGSDEIYGGDGHDSVWGGAGNDSIYGESGDDQLAGEAGDDYIAGGDGDDYVVAGNDNDTLVGGGGSDYIQGGSGNDTYSFGIGDSADTIVNYADDYETTTDNVQFGAGISVETLGLVKNDNDLRLNVGDTTDSLIIRNWFSGDAYKPDQFIFADATLMTASEMDALYQSTITYTYGTEGDDSLNGSASTDYIEGGSGNDTISGGKGFDTLVGGAGNDKYVYKSGDGIKTIVDEEGSNTLLFGEGITIGDLRLEMGSFVIRIGDSDDVIRFDDFDPNNIYATDTIMYYAFADGMVIYYQGLIDRLGFNITGTPGDDQIYGTAASDHIMGLGGNDYIVAGPSYYDGKNDFIDGGTGSDTMLGGSGNDAYVVDNVGDVVTEDAYDGTDIIQSSVTYTLPVNVENLILTGGDKINGTGNTSDNAITGNDNDNILVGGAGYDTLKGGNGTDTMYGGAGNDIYIIDDAGDVVNENAGEGKDTVQSPFTYALGANVENLTLTGDSAINGTGNALSNVLTGNSLNNILSGGAGNDNISGGAGDDYIDGGTGTDTMIGGVGNDIYVIDSSSDTLIESPNEGTDTVLSPVSLSLNSYVENLVLTGSTSIMGVGNTLNNVLTGNTGNNTLSGLEGSDTYNFGRGSGVDTIVNCMPYNAFYHNSRLDYVSTTDTIAFGEGITVTDLALIKENSNLRINIKGTTDSLIVKDWFYFDAFKIDLISFTDGTVLTSAQLEALVYQVVDTTTQIYGTTGNDLMSGTSGDSQVFGSAGNDTIFGGGGYDTLDGGTGNDVLDGGSGNDTYLFGIGSGKDMIKDYYSDTDSITTYDKLVFGEGIAPGDLVLFKEGLNLRIELPGGEDSIVVQNWSSYSHDSQNPKYDLPCQIDWFMFADGTVLTAEQFAAMDVIINGSGSSESLYSYELDGDTQLNGYEGDDSLQGGDGDDTLDGGVGDDTLVGGPGNDTYKFDIGSGVDIIKYNGDDYNSTIDIVEFGEGITVNDLELTHDSDNFIINIKGSHDKLKIHHYSGREEIDQFRFADGTVWTWAQMVAIGYISVSTGGTYSGTSNNDQINGGVGDDTLNGGVGDDTLDGGAGHDRLAGGVGNDTYKFGSGSSVDSIWNYANDYAATTDIVEFSADITVNDLDLVIDAGNLRINVKDTSDALIIGSWFSTNANRDAYRVDQFQFADGTVLTAAQLESMGCQSYGSTSNDPDIKGSMGNDKLIGYTGDDTYKFNRGSGVDKIYNYAADYATAIDTVLFGAGISTADLKLVKYRDYLLINIKDSTDTLTIKDWFKGDACKVDQFQFANGTVLTATQLEAMGYEIGHIVANPIVNQTIMEDASFVFTVTGSTFNIPGNSFREIDEEDMLTYSATLSDGTALPSWLTFDAGTMTFNGTPTNDDVGTLSLSVTVTDQAGAGVSSNFNVTVANVNDAPVVANVIATQATLEDSVFSYTLPANAFADIDVGDTLTYSATLADSTALPSWLTFDAATMTFSGIPTNDNVGTLSLKVTAIDMAGASASDDFDVTIINVNDAPLLVKPLVNQTTLEDELYTFTVPGNTFADVDLGDSLTYSATLADGSALPSWLTFDTVTMTFSGTPGNDNVGKLTLKVTATDAAGASVSDEFDVTVANVNDAPVVVNPIANQTATEDVAFIFSLPANTFNDIDAGDILTYSATLADGTGLPSWLTFDAVTMTFSGMPTNDNVGTLSLKVTAIDAAGASVSDEFNVTIANVNDAPVVVNPIAKQTATEDAAFTFNVPFDTFKDIDVGDTLTYSATLADGSALPSWLAFDAVTMTFCGMPTNEHVGMLPLKVMATDAAGSVVSSNFNVTVMNVNDAPVVVNPIADVTVRGDETFMITIPGNTFTDIDAGDTLAYSATLSDGTALPSWLAFDPATMTFSGTPINSDTLSINLTAMDCAGMSISTTFKLTVEGNITYGTNRSDFIVTGNKNDIIYALDGWIDHVYAGQGNDRIYGGNGIDIIFGGDGNDKLYGENDCDYLYGGGGNDILDGGDDIDQIYGDDGNDWLCGGKCNDYLNGGDGNDTLDGGVGKDVMSGGAGDDLYMVDNVCDIVTEFYKDGTDMIITSINYQLGCNVEHLTLTGADAINGTGNTLDNCLIGNSANNILAGAAGNDILYGESGNDILNGGAGDDILNGGDGDDIFNGNMAGNDTMLGGNGIDTVDYRSAMNGVTVKLCILAAQTISTSSGKDTLSGIENVIGSSYNDVLTGDANANVLYGLAGNDTLTGSGGNDTFVFSTVYGAANVDTITDFVSGTDVISLSAAIFTAFAANVGGTITDAGSDYIAYNSTTGALSYDADGLGSGAAVNFAIISNKPADLGNIDIIA